MPLEKPCACFDDKFGVFRSGTKQFLAFGASCINVRYAPFIIEKCDVDRVLHLGGVEAVSVFVGHDEQHAVVCAETRGL